MTMLVSENLMIMHKEHLEGKDHSVENLRKLGPRTGAHQLAQRPKLWEDAHVFACEVLKLASSYCNKQICSIL